MSESLFSAGEIGDLEKIKELLNQGVDINSTNLFDSSLLHIVMKNNHPYCVEFLIQNGAECKLSKYNFGNIPLHFAIYYGHKNIIDIVIKYTPDINYQNQLGFSPLHICAQENLIDFSNSLILAGANINNSNQEGVTPLLVAASYGHTNIVSFFINNGAYINAQNTNGYTALHLAVIHQSDETVKLLLMAGIDPNIIDHNGNTAFQLLNNKKKKNIHKIFESFNSYNELTSKVSSQEVLISHRKMKL